MSNLSYRGLGGWNDIAVLATYDNPYCTKVGDSIKFRPSYGSLVRLILCPYVDKVVVPSIDESVRIVDRTEGVEVPPAYEELVDDEQD